MFCPVCGGSKFEQLIGGICSRVCVYCGKGLYCQDELANEIEESSLPISNPGKAIKLRSAFNKIPGNKAQGKKNLARNKAFHDEIKKNACRIRKQQKWLEEIVANPADIEFKMFDGTVEEFIQQAKSKREKK